MILGRVSLLDCLVFLVFLVPQLLYNVGFRDLILCGLRALPFLVIKLPLGFFYEQFLVSKEERPPFVKQASYFEDIVIRCVRYAFANIPASIGRVFFSKAVALPFLRFRMLRHGYVRSPISWREVKMGNLNGLWIVGDESSKPDIVVYYAHGGGFSMGSSYFYLEFLMVWLTLLKKSGYRNPAIFSLEYSLVGNSTRDACFPVQMNEAILGYKYVISIIGDPSRVCVGGDSAGATLILSMLLQLANTRKTKCADVDNPDVPGMAVLISPWTTLTSPLHKNTRSDYLDTATLEGYAHQYAGTHRQGSKEKEICITDPIISPGDCISPAWWRSASPSKGYFMTYGSEEVFANEIRKAVNQLRKANVIASTKEAEGGIHAWPVAALFLSRTPEARQRGLHIIVQEIRKRMGD
ncbi:hypothetical protein PVAG01_09474 [Phlyctema vagabunda]|uniref:Alpha/beta hydrolase fold-3 domain-containing protein n=1 Tax=Phlyctema vagabunda TaxID=108571 RepID=A0ABR4P7F7_9HELO